MDYEENFTIVLTSELNVLPIDSDDHQQGDKDAAITLIEYGDFADKVCGSAFWSVKSVQKMFGNEVRFVHRSFVNASQTDALRAAEAAEAAASQDKFWQMHRHLYTHQERLTEDALLQHAALLGLDTDKVRIELRTHQHRERIARLYETGVQIGVVTTPTFFINGVKYEGEANELMIAVASVVNRKQ
jgi:protein-disulfide isomerase